MPSVLAAVVTDIIKRKVYCIIYNLAQGDLNKMSSYGREEFGESIYF